MKTMITLLVAAMLLCGGALSAGTIDWTEWTSDNVNTTGQFLGVMHNLAIGVTISGPRGYYNAPYQTDLVSFYLGYPSWKPTSTFVGGQVGNAPPQSYNSILDVGYLAGYSSGSIGTTTIYFSAPVLNPVIAIWSLGGQTATPSTPLAKFDFLGTPFTIESGGPTDEFLTTGTSIYVCQDNANAVCGNEGAGTVMFHGVYNSLSFQNPVYENNYAFTVGGQIPPLPPVPEPATMTLFGAGFGVIALGLVRRKR